MFVWYIYANLHIKYRGWNMSEPETGCDPSTSPWKRSVSWTIVSNHPSLATLVEWRGNAWPSFFFFRKIDQIKANYQEVAKRRFRLPERRREKGGDHRPRVRVWRGEATSFFCWGDMQGKLKGCSPHRYYCHSILLNDVQ